MQQKPADARHRREPSAPDVVDGVTGDDDGGREDGDVELALFRRIRSFSNVSSRISSSRVVRGPSRGYRRYFNDPLSMFTAEADDPDQPGEPCDSDGDPPAQPLSASPADDEPLEHGQLPPRRDPNLRSADDPSIGLEKFALNGVAWRDAMVQACAALLGKTTSQLEHDYNVAVAASAAPNTAFASETSSFEPVPRDLADYAIITALKEQDSFAMQNATSWLFNMMDRTGAGYVLRDEFVRYAPFIGPVADAAVAGLVFDELVREQVRAANEAQLAAEANNGKARKPSGERARESQKQPPNGLRRRKPSSNRQSQQAESSTETSHDTTATATATAPEGSTSRTFDKPSRDLYPPAAAMRFDIWRRFFAAVQDKYHCHDDEWARVKQELGIDPSEALIKSQGALDHSDVFPTLGKLYLTQRYLIFFAAVGRNHYVARLGAIAEVTTGAIPIMMRDCMKVHLESEAKAALDGVSPLVKDGPEESQSREGKRKESDERQEPTLSQHVGKLMRQFMSIRKPLMFSLLEFRETKRRDNWVHLVKEMVAAHKLHVQLGFGSAGRAVPSLRERSRASADVGASSEGTSEDDVGARQNHEIKSLNYSRSPFRNEPSPPLLAVAAHANLVRYRSLRRVTSKHVSSCLLIFSHAERNTQLINWYTDSVRSYDNQKSRTWIERALAAIRENMDTNNRMYNVQDDEPFDVGRLGDAIGRFAELCSPMARVIQFLTHLFQWRNPPATVLAILVCMTIAMKGLVHYVPAAVVFLQAAWVVETKYNWLGLGMGRAESEDAERRQANVLALVAQVHDALQAAQNVLGRLNRELGKVQSLFLWGCEEWQSWVAVCALCVVGLVLVMIPSGTLFVLFFFLMFFKHFLPPTNPGIEFWQSLPSRIDERRDVPAGRRRRRGGGGGGGADTRESEGHRARGRKNMAVG